MSFSRNFIFTSSGQILAFVVGLAFSILVARQLGPEGQGVFALWLLIPTLAARFVHFGFDAATTYFIKENSFTLVDITSAALALIFTFFIVAMALPLLLYLEVIGPFAGLHLQIAFILVPMAALFLTRTLFFGYLVGQNRLKLHSVLSVAEASLPLIFLLAALSFDQITPTSVMVSIFASIVLVVFVLMIRIRVKFTRLNPTYIAAAARYGIKSWLNNLANQLIYRVDMLLIAYFLGPLEVGLYSISVLLVEKLWFFLNAVGNALFPTVRELSMHEGARITASITRINFFITAILLVVLLVLAKFFIWLLFGASYTGSVIPLYWLLPGSLALSVAKVLVYHLGAINRLDLAIKSSMPALVLNTVLNLFLIPSHGIVGAAVATSISYLFYAMISIHLYSSLTGLNVSTLIIVTRADFELLASTVKRLVRRS